MAAHSSRWPEWPLPDPLTASGNAWPNETAIDREILKDPYPKQAGPYSASVTKDVSSRHK
eukprot:1153050-Pelagomonas_calceolata.AAC.13